jgi:hypothetical protein
MVATNDWAAIGLRILGSLGGAGAEGDDIAQENK